MDDIRIYKKVVLPISSCDVKLLVVVNINILQNVHNLAQKYAKKMEENNLKNYVLTGETSLEREVKYCVFATCIVDFIVDRMLF